MLPKLQHSQKFLQELETFKKKSNLVRSERIKMEVQHLIYQLERYIKDLDHHYDTRNNGYIKPSMTEDLRFNINQTRIKIENTLKNSI